MKGAALLWAFQVPSVLRSSTQTTRAFTSSLGAMSSGDSKYLVVDPFCFRQFKEKDASKTYGGSVFSMSIAEFEKIVNERYQEENLKDGYAPFCKHIFLANDFTGDDGRVNVLPITKDNEHLLRTEYAARNEKELPVLQRYFPLEAVGGTKKLPTAAYLDLILYSREQIQKETEAMGKDDREETAPWGIVSIKAQDVDYELPMNPITQLRNALGKDQGGSGIPLEREIYMESVNYWKDNANIS